MAERLYTTRDGATVDLAAVTMIKRYQQTDDDNKPIKDSFQTWVCTLGGSVQVVDNEERESIEKAWRAFLQAMNALQIYEPKQTQEVEQPQPGHWRCPDCGDIGNAVGRKVCRSCGKARP